MKYSYMKDANPKETSIASGICAFCIDCIAIIEKHKYKTEWIGRNESHHALVPNIPVFHDLETN